MFFSSALTDVGTVFSSSCKTFFNSVDCSSVLSASKYLSNLLIDTSVCSIVSNFYAFTVFFELPHLQLFFGINVVQTASALIINKSELAGLTPSINNTAESLLAAIINNILGGKQGVKFMSIDFTYWGYGVLEKKRIDTIVINLYNPIPIIDGIPNIDAIAFMISPNNY